ncbi:MAG: hypothetical protein MRZ98_02685, partial [Clostridiales bacterium]|nr:hypothetical protein [Clostridiales bacterium]
PLTIVRFLCYSVHGELLCGGWFVGTAILPLEFSFFFPFVLPMYYISTLITIFADKIKIPANRQGTLSFSSGFSGF